VNDPVIIPRLCDLPHILPGLTGKIELVFEGEQEGPVKVSRALVGKAVRETFKRYFPDPLRKRPRRAQQQQPGKADPEDPEYGKVVRWFEAGNAIEVSDEMPVEAYAAELNKVAGLREISRRHLAEAETKYELPSVMEFVLEGLHQSSRIAKDEVDHRTSYKDLVGSILSGAASPLEED